MSHDVSSFYFASNSADIIENIFGFVEMCGIFKAFDFSVYVKINFKIVAVVNSVKM